MHKKIFIIILIFIFSANGILYSQEALSLYEVIKEAVKNNPGILAAKKRWEASLARVPQAKSLDNPNIGLTFEKAPRGTIKFDRTMPEDRMLSLTQMFPFFGKLSLKGKIALVESQMFAAEYKQKELEVVNAVKNGYYDLFMNDKEIELNEQNLSLLKSIAKTAEAKYVVGEASQEELFKLNSETAKLSNVIINLKEEKKAKETRLNVLLNRDPQASLGNPELTEDVSFNRDIKSLYQATLLNQPELMVFSYAIEKNKYAESLAKRSFFPDLMAGITQRGIASGGLGPWDLMLSFTMPFWFWTKQRYEVKEAIANLEEAKAAYKAMQNRAFAETKELSVKIEIAKNKINLYKTNLIPILEGSISSSLAGFTSAKGDFMMLLDSLRMLTETKMSYYQALVEYNMNVADLERAVGMDLKEVKK